MTEKINDLLSRPLQMGEEINYAEDGIVSKTILDKPEGTITLFALDGGQNISEHSAPHHALVEVLEGSGEFIIEEKSVEVPAGEHLIMPANVPHAVKANQQFKMLLIMISSEE
ncbi:MAG: cupin domain-containing protein [bacterium]